MCGKACPCPDSVVVTLFWIGKFTLLGALNQFQNKGAVLIFRLFQLDAQPSDLCNDQQRLQACFHWNFEEALLLCHFRSASELSLSKLSLSELSLSKLSLSEPSLSEPLFLKLPLTVRGTVTSQLWLLNLPNSKLSIFTFEIWTFKTFTFELLLSELSVAKLSLSKLSLSKLSLSKLSLSNLSYFTLSLSQC